jgi:hypothetical protein
MDIQMLYRTHPVNGICENCYFYDNCAQAKLLGKPVIVTGDSGEATIVHLACEDYYYVFAD